MQYVTVLAIAAVLVYAFCSGFHTIGDFDFGWQIATGRYVAQHHQVPRSEVFSYSDPGAAWWYPVLSGLIFIGFFS
jgi:hypothetical protein